MDQGERILKATAEAIRRGTLAGMEPEERAAAVIGARAFNYLMDLPAVQLKALADIYEVELAPEAYDHAPDPSPGPWRFD